MSLRLNSMSSQFLITFLCNLCSELVGQKLLRPSWELRLWQSEFDYRWDGICICFSILVLWLCVKNQLGRGRKHCFVDFCSLTVLESSVDVGAGVGQKSYFGTAEIASFSSQDFRWSNRHNTFWHVVSTGYFYVLFLWIIAVSNFRPLEIYENLSLPLSTITFAVNSHADNHFCKHIYLLQILFSTKSVFLLKYMLRFWLTFFILKFHLCETPFLFFLMKTIVYRKNLFIEPK